MRIGFLAWVGCVFLMGAAPSQSAVSQNRVTILYDAFTNKPGVETDWGFAALVEVNGRKILFDTGNDANRLEKNAKQLGVDGLGRT